MIKRSSSLTDYLKDLYQYVGFLGLKNGAMLLASLASLKLGRSLKVKTTGLVESWAIFQILRRARVFKVAAAGPDQFRVIYTPCEDGGVEVRMALRMPPSVSSDSAVFCQIFVNKEYLHVLEWFTLNCPGGIATILDVGANIGCASLFFGACLPRVRIFCIEPEPGNYSRLRINLEMNPQIDIKSHQAAIWTRACTLHCVRDFRDRREYSFRFVESDGESDASSSGVPALDIQTIASMAGFETVDFLKLDVEGAEATLMRDQSFTMFLKQKVARVAVEVHEEFISVREVKEVLDSLGFQTGAVDEFVVGIKLA